MTGILDLSQYDVNNTPDPTAVDEGEHKIRIIECEGIKEDKNGNNYFMPRFEIPEEPTSKDFTYFIAMPNSSMDAKEMNRTLAKLKNFGLAFGLDFSHEISFDDLAGLEGWALLGRKDDPEYGPQNYIKKFITGA